MKKMRFFILSNLVILTFGLLSCGGGSQDESSQNDSAAVQTKEASSTTNIDLVAGKKIYTEKCMVCHQESGLGVPGTFPPLAKSDYLQADKMRAVKQAIYGSKTPITVNGVQYPGGIMTVFEKELSDQQVLDVVNYVLNSWGNQMGAVTLDDVKAARSAK